MRATAALSSVRPWRRERGDSADELIHTDGRSASASMPTRRRNLNLRHGGLVSIPSRVLEISWPRSDVFPWLRDGPWMRIIAGKGLPSSRLSFLGGDAWRMPTRSGRGAQGPDCMYLFYSRVICVRRNALSLDRRFPRASFVRTILKLYLPLC
jgi:hypothetical protein